MESILRVKNFGPIKDAELDLRNVNVLIGPQASGKSTLAKLYTICMSPHMLFGVDVIEYSRNSNIPSKASIDFFIYSLFEYGIRNFYSQESEIYFETSTHSVSISNSELVFKDELKVSRLKSAFESGDYSSVKTLVSELRSKSSSYNAICSFIFADAINDDSEELRLKEAVEKAEILRHDLFFNSEKVIYVPAERTILNLIKRAALNLQKHQVPIPSHLLEYAALFERASLELKELDLKFIKNGAVFRNEGGDDKIFFSEDKSLKLTESASGFQSLVPMLVPIHYLRKSNLKTRNVHLSFVIEEPETNLFPKAQYDVLKFLESGRNDDSIGQVDYGSTHTYTTHSPFILTSLNNMLYAWKKGNGASDEVKDRISAVLNEQHWIDPKRFSAYEVKDGTAVSIFDRETGLIQESMMDEVSEDVLEDFRKIALAAKED